MAQNTTIDIPPKIWTLITDSDVEQVCFQNATNGYIVLKATVGADSAPTDDIGGITYNTMMGERLVDLADLFPGVSGANRLWVWSPFGGKMFISHA